MAEYLWDLHIAAIAVNNASVEAWPVPNAPEPFQLHSMLLANFGMPLGELFDLDALAADCAADGVYESLLVSSPLHVVGGVASPPNAVAIK